MSLSVEQILATGDSAPVPVSVTDWKGGVFVRRLSAFEAIKVSAALQALDGDPVTVAQDRLVLSLAAFLCDENGATLLTPDQARVVCSKNGNASAVNQIVEAAHALNAIDADSAKAAAKN